jgi:hypothetical protein
MPGGEEPALPVDRQKRLSSVMLFTKKATSQPPHRTPSRKFRMS